MIGLSYSRWKDAECPYRFHAIHIARTHKEPETEPMLVGGAVANALKEYRRHCYGKARPSDLEWFSGLQFDENIKDQCLDLIENFKSSEFVQVPLTAQYVAVEERVAFDENLVRLTRKNGEDPWFGRAGNVAFRIIADFMYRMDDTLYIIDDKTGRGEPDPWQVELYAYLGPRSLPKDKAMGIKRAVCIFNEIRKKSKDIVGEFDLGDRAWAGRMRSKILAKISEVNSWSEFPALACSRCAWCTVPECPVRDEASKQITRALPEEVPSIPVDIHDKETAQKAVLFLMFADKLTKQVKSALRKYVEENEPVVAGGKSAELRANSSWKPKDLHMLVRTLLSYGADQDVIWSNLSLSATALRKICRTSGLMDRYPLLEAMGESRELSPRFGLYAPKKADF